MGGTVLVPRFSNFAHLVFQQHYYPGRYYLQEEFNHVTQRQDHGLGVDNTAPWKC